MGLSAEERLETLEDRIDRYQGRIPGQPCAHCEEGWVHEEAGVLRCDDCGYLGYL